MTGSMYAAVAGLKAHMSKLNVIGNNIANINTVGYKSQRAVFKDAMYSVYSSGSNGSSTAGGRNPSQMGFGSQVSSIDLNMATGTYTPGNATDCMIYGSGFFLVGDKTLANTIDPLDPNSMKSLSLTRVGDFKFGPDGYLVDGNGNVVYGFMNSGTGVDMNTNNPTICDQLVPIRLPKLNTAYRDEDGNFITKATYDALDPDAKALCSVTHEVKYAQCSKDGKNIALRDYKATDDDPAAVDIELPFAQLDSVSIDSQTGAITGTNRETGDIIIVGYLAIGNVTNPNGVSHTDGFYYSCDAGAGDLQISMLGGVSSDLGITHVNGSLYADALAEAIVKDGTLDADALQSDKMMIGSTGDTSIMTGGLEGSNVDLASEFTEMIATQRGYQANTRIISVTDAMLEELVNIKR